MSRRLLRFAIIVILMSIFHEIYHGDLHTAALLATSLLGFKEELEDMFGEKDD